ncbi:cytoskeletal protein binding protein, partial [Spiromyces aspiralis]
MSIPRILIAIYDYHAQDDEELSFKEGDIFYELDATNPDWLKVRLRLPPNNEQQEREGLIPGNYVQELTPKMTAKVLYDYNPQEPDETQIVADEVIHVLRDDDPDWILVKSRKGCGMVPRTYIETQDSAAHHQQHSQTMDAPEPGHQPDSSSSSSFFSVVEKKRKNLKSNIGVTEDCFVYSSGDDREPEARWHLSEVRDCTSNRQILCIEVGGPNPRTFEFTCSSKTEAEQIADKVNDARKNCSHAPAPSHHVKEDKKKDEVDEMKAGGPGRHPLAVALYDFEAQEDDELTIQEGDQLEVTDKDSSPEWWLVRHSSPGRGSKEGLVPSNYIRIVGEASGDQAGGAPIQHASPEDAPTPQPKQPAGAKVSRVKTTDSEDIPLNKLVQNRQQKPGPANVRVWTDKTGTYKVEAEFLSLEPNNQVNLFKTNGAKIFVPLEKLDSADVLYIEQKTGKKLLPAHASAQPLTARQRQEAEAKKHPDRKKVNYDWDWFDFFTLKADINADFALKYATTFVADRLDNESISEITAERMRSLGVRESDIPLIERAFQVHMGTPVLSEVKPSGPGSASGVPHRPPAAVGVPHQQRQETQPGGVKPLNSSLEANLRMRRQIQDDEALARRLQEEEEKRRRRDGSAHARQGPGHKPAPPMNNVGSSAAQPARSAAPGDPFTNFAFPKSDSSRPMSPANRPHAPNRSATSVVDPSQLSSVRDKLAAAAAAANQSPARPGMDYPTTAPAPQDDAWMAKSNLKPVINSKPKRSPVQAAFPQQNTKPLIPTPSSATTIKPTITNANLGTSTAVTSVPVTDMPGISHSPLSLPHNPPQTVAQLTAMNDAANAKAQELRNRELQLQQQREYLEKQAMLLKQQQEQLTQARQTQQVEQQLRQIREQKERL